jgi:mono/diheme cytochrome c family protein
METSARQSHGNRILSILAGMVFGCLTMLMMIVCLVGGLIVLAARANAAYWAGNGDLQAFQGSSAGLEGEVIFDQRCSHCHATGTQMRVGPGLAGLFSPGGPELPAGVDYDGRLPNGEEITEVNVAEWIRDGGRGEIGAMPGQRLTDEQMDRLIEYLKTLE